MAVMINKEHQGYLPGLHRLELRRSIREQAIAYGTRMMGGVTSPGKGGTKHLDLPVFDTVAQSDEEQRLFLQRDLRSRAVRG